MKENSHLSILECEENTDLGNMGIGNEIKFENVKKLL